MKEEEHNAIRRESIERDLRILEEIEKLSRRVDVTNIATMLCGISLIVHIVCNL